jgi:peptidoglycan hydrolase-like protein with peptidoglycan-binding domain
MMADGVAGEKTRNLIYQEAGKSAPSSGKTEASPAQTENSALKTAQASSSSGKAAAEQTSSASSGSLFGGNYATLRPGATGSRVRLLQSRLIALGFLNGSADGKYGRQTTPAGVSFQKSSGLSADGLAGKKTLKALENGNAQGAGSSGAASDSGKSAESTGAQSSASADPSSGRTASGPSGGQVRLLHWYNDVKPSLRSGQTLYVYEPSSGQGWNLRIYSCGRHCDAEPCTAEDTASMLKAFGGKNTWSQKAVYVKLPNGSWTVGSTHDMPHMSGSVKDNNFNGHLCVHFLRTMSEAQEYDPSYGVSNQNTIRAFWKSLTGEEITE